MASWNYHSKTYRVEMGSKKNGPYVRRYFSVKEYGSKERAKKAAAKFEAQTLKTPEFQEYYRYKVNTRPVLAPRNTSSVQVTGVIFCRGGKTRNGNKYYAPRFRVYFNSAVANGSYALRTLGAYPAMKAAIEHRLELEGAAADESEIKRIFNAWRRKPKVKDFLRAHDIPLWG